MLFFLLENPNISHDIKKYVGDRSAKLLKANSDMKSQVEFYNKIYVDGHGSFFGKFLLPIRKAYLSDKEIFAINTAFEEKGYVIQKPKKATDTLSNKINYEKMLVKADSEEKNYPRENRFNT